ncbi:hypothetical protein [Endozoicomonas euniceicola]|uniref:Uncharacterized protein n=1 Tax=Endozoicomonas euniceicola TaxID=1234143 RepID=A0ABY6GVD8_9GAMM|nr:hypothetical protein [Endozoicomonas euniceicola]UYM16359.1 hypothetical protein NX720_26805 [Endozoicomonas euniceicola]
MSYVKLAYIFLAPLILLLLEACSQKYGEQPSGEPYVGQQPLDSMTPDPDDPAQTGFWVPAREWATANHLVGLSEGFYGQLLSGQC